MDDPAQEKKNALHFNDRFPVASLDLSARPCHLHVRPRRDTIPIPMAGRRLGERARWELSGAGRRQRLAAASSSPQHAAAIKNGQWVQRRRPWNVEIETVGSCVLLCRHDAA